MVLLSQEIYQETREIVIGQRAKSQLLVELSDWFMDKYSVQIINFLFDKVPGPNSKRYRLYVIIENEADKKKLQPDIFHPIEKYQKQIAKKFQQLALKYKFIDKAKLKDLFVAFNDYSDEAKTMANWKAIEEAKEKIERKYSSVWGLLAMFSSTVVFYFSDSQIQENDENGLSEKIKNDYYEILKKYDEMDYYTIENFVIKFDSKENLDKNYEGNLYYYA